MEKILKIVITIMLILIILILLFFTVDYKRAENNQKPLFCIHTKIHKDGGTTEYICLGYKVISFNTLSGYNKVQIGSYFMDYDDFNEDIKLFEREIVKIEKDDVSYVLNEEDEKSILKILNNLTFSDITCDGLPEYYIKVKIDDEEKIYALEIFNEISHIRFNNQEAVLSLIEISKINSIISEYFN